MNLFRLDECDVCNGFSFSAEGHKSIFASFYCYFPINILYYTLVDHLHAGTWYSARPHAFFVFCLYL